MKLPIYLIVLFTFSIVTLGANLENKAERQKTRRTGWITKASQLILPALAVMGNIGAGVNSAPLSNNALSHLQPNQGNNPQRSDWSTPPSFSKGAISNPNFTASNPFDSERTSKPKTSERQRVEKRWSKRSSKAPGQRRRTDQARPLEHNSTRTDSKRPEQQRTTPSRLLGQTSARLAIPYPRQGGNCEVNLNIKTKQYNECDQKLEKCNNARMGDQIDLGKCQARAEIDIENMPKSVVTKTCQNLAKQEDSAICKNQNTQEVTKLTKENTQLTNENTFLKKENNHCQNSLTQANKETTKLTQKLDVANKATADAKSEAKAHAEATIGTGAGLGFSGLLGAAALIYAAYQKGKSKGVEEIRHFDAKNGRKDQEQHLKEIKELRKGCDNRAKAVVKIFKDQAKYGANMDEEAKVALIKMINHNQALK